jgi:hypothetical protein
MDTGKCRVCGLVWYLEDNKLMNHNRSVFSKRKPGEKWCPGSGKSPK